MATNRISGSSPSAEAIGGTIGNSAGVTTPRVLENSDMNAATMPNTSGTRIGGILLPIHDARMSMVPALIATEISIPTPQIMISVAQGTDAIALRSSPSLRSSAITENRLAIRPMSIFELTRRAVGLSGNIR